MGNRKPGYNSTYTQWATKYQYEKKVRNFSDIQINK